MIAELVIDSKREKVTAVQSQYAKAKVEALYEDEQAMIDMPDERPEIKQLRD